MKKSFVLILGLAATCPVLAADNYLFPTDIVDEGRIDLQAGISKSTYSHSYDIDAHGKTGYGEEKLRSVGENIELRYGLGSDTHLGLGLPYESFSRREWNATPGSVMHFGVAHQDMNGNENLQLWVKHRFIEGIDSPLSLTATVGIKANTANKHRTGAWADATVGWKWSDQLRGYVSYEADISDQDELPDRHTMQAGLHEQVSERLTLVPKVYFFHAESASRYSATTLHATNGFGAGLFAQWQALPSTYVIPSVGYSHLDGYRDGPYLTYGDSNNGKTVSLTLYHLF
jgi:hypothetical protein